MFNSVRLWLDKKLSRLFAFWFVLAMILPIFSLLFFTWESFHERRMLLEKQVAEAQKSKMIQIEKFYSQNFVETYRQEILSEFSRMGDYFRKQILPWRSVELENAVNKVAIMMGAENNKEIQSILETKISNHFVDDKKQVEEMTDWYYEQYLPSLGFMVAKTSDKDLLNEIEKQRFFTVQFLRFDYKNPQYQDVFDFLALSELKKISFDPLKDPEFQEGREELLLYQKSIEILRERQRIRTLYFPSHEREICSGCGKLKVLDDQKIKDLKEIFQGLKVFENSEFSASLLVPLFEKRKERIQKVSRIATNYYKIFEESQKLYKGHLLHKGEVESGREFKKSLIAMEEILLWIQQESEIVTVRERARVLYSQILSMKTELEEILVDVNSYLKPGYEGNTLDLLTNSVSAALEIEKDKLPERLEAWIKNQGVFEIHKTHPFLITFLQIQKLFYKGMNQADWFEFRRSVDLWDFPFSTLYLSHQRHPKSKISMDIPRDMHADLMIHKKTPLQQLKDTDWHILARIIEFLMSDLFVGEISQNDSDRMYLEAFITGQSLRETRRKFMSIGSGENELDFIWDIYPTGFDFDGFLSANEERPLAMLFTFFRGEVARRIFARIYNMELERSLVKNRLPIMDFREKFLLQTPETRQKDVSIPEFSKMKPGIRELYYSIFDLKYGLKNPPGEQKSGFFHFLLHYLGLSPDYPKARNAWWDQSTQGLLLRLHSSPEESGGSRLDYLKPDWQVLEYFSKRLSAEELEKIIVWKKDPTAPYFFRYHENGAEKLGFLFASSLFVNHVFFFSLDTKIAYKEVDDLFLFLVLICTLALYLAWKLGKLLAEKVVQPVNYLAENVVLYTNGELKEPVKIFRSDEIGQVTHSFNTMVENIEEKIREMEAINTLNNYLLAGKDLSFLMGHAVEQFSTLSDSKLGYLGFFENESKDKTMAFSLWSETELGEEEKNLVSQEILSRFASCLAQDFCFFEKVEINHRLHEHVLVHKISSKSGSLADLGGILEELSDGSVKASTHSIEGFLVLFDYNLSLFNEEKKSFIRSLASQTGTVVLKAWLDKLKKDNEEGQNIQTGLMPTKSPDTKGCLDVAFSFVAAKYLGGDFFDFVFFPQKHKIGFLISDVSGKGIGPSLFGATCKAFLKLLAKDSGKTGNTLDEINENLCYKKNNSLFASAFYLTIDLETLKMTYSSAGHNRMYLYRKSKNELERLSAKGLVLGMFTPAIYETKTTQLEEGDWIILYTDGVNELENPRLELYGFDRFESLILANIQKTAEEFKQELLEDLVVWRDGAAPSDDITFILIKVCSRIPAEPAQV